MRIAPTSDDQVGEVLVRASGDAPATWAIGSLFAPCVSGRDRWRSRCIAGDATSRRRHPAHVHAQAEAISFFSTEP